MSKLKNQLAGYRPVVVPTPRQIPDQAPNYRRRVVPRVKRPIHIEKKIPTSVIVGFILAILLGPLGIIFCIAGIGEAVKRQRGVGLAIAGIVIGLMIWGSATFVVTGKWYRVEFKEIQDQRR